MTWRVQVDERAARELYRLPKDAVRRISEAIGALSRQPRPPGAKKLTGREGYRVRVGDYRILYDVDDDEKSLQVYRIGHRKEIYR